MPAAAGVLLLLSFLVALVVGRDGDGVTGVLVAAAVATATGVAVAAGGVGAGVARDGEVMGALTAAGAAIAIAAGAIAIVGATAGARAGGVDVISVMTAAAAAVVRAGNTRFSFLLQGTMTVPSWNNCKATAAAVFSAGRGRGEVIG